MVDLGNVRAGHPGRKWRNRGVVAAAIPAVGVTARCSSELMDGVGVALMPLQLFVAGGIKERRTDSIRRRSTYS